MLSWIKNTNDWKMEEVSIVCSTVRGLTTERGTVFRVCQDLCVWDGTQSLEMVAMCDHRAGHRLWRGAFTCHFHDSKNRGSIAQHCFLTVFRLYWLVSWAPSPSRY